MLQPKVSPHKHFTIKGFWPSNIFAKITIILLYILDVLTICAAYAGHIRPAHTFIGSIAPSLTMAFPAFLYITVAVMIGFFFFWKTAATLQLITLAIVLPSAYTISPLHINRYTEKESDKDRRFTLMTYNIMCFFDFDGPFKPGQPNRTVQYILDKNPDILCLQETLQAAYVNTLNITRTQRNLRDLRYPYQLHWHDGGTAIYSKYPLREIEIGDDPSMPWPHYKAARVYLNNDSITVINSHLQSLGLDSSDKNIYHKITDGELDIDSVETASQKIMDKLTTAFMKRAVQAEWIRQTLDSIKGNVIVCGDFNDTPLSYATRTVKGNDMVDAFEHTSFGPRISFHDNNMYFRIDHMFYRGNFTAYRTVIDSQPSSDHYPYMTYFMFADKK